MHTTPPGGLVRNVILLAFADRKRPDYLVSVLSIVRLELTTLLHPEVRSTTELYRQVPRPGVEPGTLA